MKKTLVIIIVIIALCLVAPIVSTSFAAPNHGVISIAFDDGIQSQYDYAFPLMQTRGIKATFYVVTDLISDFSNNNDFLSIAELNTLQDYGCEIGSHSKTHPPFTQISDSQIREECSVSKQVLQSYGFAADNFAYPYGGTDDHIDSIVSQYYRSARSAYAPPYVMPLPTSQFRLTAFAGETGDSTALPQLKNMVDQVYSTNGWTIIFFHNIIPNVSNASYTISTQDFSSFLDYIISKGVQTLTVNQALDLATSPLTMATNYGTVSPISGQYATGTTITINAALPAVGPGERYVWLGWAGSGVGSYSGMNNPASIIMNGPITEQANWRRECYLTVDNGGFGDATGSGWYVSGASASFSISPTEVIGGAGMRYVFTNWFGSSTSTSPTASILMNDPEAVTATWKIQYLVTFGQSGLDSFASGTVVTVDGSAKAYSDLPFSKWVDAGGSVVYSYTSTVSSSVSGKQFAFTGVVGAASPVSVSAPVTVTGNYQIQYLVTFGQSGLDSFASGTVVTVDGSAKAYSDLPFSKWVDGGSSVTYTYSDPVASSVSGSRFKLSSVIGLVSPITVSGPTSVIATYENQYQVNFSQSGVDTDFVGTVVTVDDVNYTRTGVSFWWNSGSSHSFAFQSPLVVGASNKYMWALTSGLSNQQSGSITTSASGNITANYYQIQYLVTFGQSGLDSFASGTVVTVDGSAKAYSDLPFSKWVDAGGSVVYSYTSTVSSSVSGKQFAFTGVVGAASPVSVSAPVTVTGNYQTQYYLDIVSSYGTVGGMGWYDSDSTAYATVTPLIVNGSTGVRYVFTNWSGNALGATSPSDPITMNAPKTATANYRTQYSIIVTSAHDSPTPSAWVDVGKNFPVIVTSPTEIVPNDHQFVCTGYSVDGGASQAGTNYTFTNVQAAHTIVFNWKEQFWIVFQQTGLPDGVTANVVLNSPKHTLPYSDWFDQGLSLEFAYEDQLPSGFGAQYVLTSTSDSPPLKVGAPINVTGHYAMQYAIEMFGVIAIPVVLVVLVIGIILLRRRRKKT